MKIQKINSVNSVKGILKPENNSGCAAFKGYSEITFASKLKEYNLNKNAIELHYNSLISNIQNERNTFFDGAMVELKSEFEKSDLREKMVQYDRIFKDYPDGDAKGNVNSIFDLINRYSQNAFLKEEDNIATLKKGIMNYILRSPFERKRKPICIYNQ